MNKKINKEGISLAVLAITIVVSIILLSALTVNLNSNIKKSKISKFVYDISNIEDALNSYYTLKNELPKNIIDIGYIIIFSITIVAIIYIIYLIKKIKMLSITNSYTYPIFIETLTDFIILESKENNKYHKNNTITRKV